MLALVIDDSRAVRIIIRHILREMAMEVVEAGDGREALEQLQRNPDVELVLVDWNMPVMDGLEFIRQVRSQPCYDEVRIVMVTTETESAQVSRALSAGANEYVMKPFNKDVLVAKLGLLDIFGEQPMPRIRILVVDDSVVIRRMVSDELNRDPELEVVGTASNGRIALAKLAQLSPDLVILDINMPEMDGLEALKELRKTYPRLPVIMFSSLTERGAEATLDALALGATDYFTKPSSEEGLDASLRVIREELVPEIKALCAPPGQKMSPAGTGTGGLSAGKAPPAGTGTVRLLAVGASTGGPNALAEVFTRLPGDFPVPIVIVQHMPPMFTRLLAERLSAQSPIRVQEATSGCLLKPGEAWIAPGDYHMTVVRNGLDFRLLLHQGPPENSCRPAVDVLLRSVAKTFGADTLTVILTGMGQDGLRGCELLREAGGQVLAQDEASSVVWGMPGYVAQAGLADRVLPLSMIGGEIVKRVRGQKSQG